MDTLLQKLQQTVTHIHALHDTFSNAENFNETNNLDYEIYQHNLSNLQESLSNLSYIDQLYIEHNRQMILSDFIEYIFFGRLYYSIVEEEDRYIFIRAILSFVNMLMCYESMTVSDNLRNSFLLNLSMRIPEIQEEELFSTLLSFEGKVGLTEKESDAERPLNQYFDKLLPKTAGGLWHELLVYIFLLRNDVGYIIPLLLSQRLIGLKDHIVPPDYLILSKEKRLYGIEVGGMKERQSSSFALRTAIPTATIDTLNSRTDRCPICKKWINFCPFVIDRYSDINSNIESHEIRCLSVCTLFNRSEIAAGNCSYTKYKRRRIQRADTHHEFSNNLHYHYICVLENVDHEKAQEIIDAEDSTALKTHFPYYSGLEGLIYS